MVGIVSNSAALFAQQNLNRASTNSELSIARLSSGNAIVKASDDVSGLAIGTVLKTDVSTLRTVLKTAAQANSLLNIADGALQNIADILQRQKSLAVQANSGTLTSNERAFLNQEFTNLTLEIDRIVTNTEFNGVKLLNGNIASNSTLTFADPAAAANFATAGTLGSTYLTTTSTVAISNASDPSLIGSLGNAEVGGLFTSTSSATFYLTINGQTYVEENVDISGATKSLVFQNSDTGARITVTLQDQTGASESQGDIDTIAAGIEADLANITVYQSRTTSNNATTGLPATAFANTILEGGDYQDFTLKSSSFVTASDTGPGISSFEVTAESATDGTDGKISVTIGGEVFSTATNKFTSSNNTNLKGVGIVTLTNASDSNETFLINFAGLLSSSVGIDTSASATALEDALNTLFGVGSTGGLTFQVGTEVTDTIGLTLNSAATTSIYLNDSSVVTSLSVTTAANAQTASGVLDNAINTITSLRASVGALQSRFDFAASVISSSIQNVEAARSGFLDVDIAAESSKFASSQVLLQAGISVLAQANQLPQNLLKLIG
ncbi:MAG: hypothetical protein H6908_01485 [Hyphomicrobiales bacterium]|nr:hypothetical protein [Hyphomicrobiales bacterium]